MRSAVPAFLFSWSMSSPVKIYNLVQADRKARESNNLLYMYRQRVPYLFRLNQGLITIIIIKLRVWISGVPISNTLQLL